MILEILFAIPMFILIWFLVFKFKLKYDKKKLIKDLPKKLEKQNKKFYSDGKELDLKEILGLEVEKKEVTAPDSTNARIPGKIVENPNPGKKVAKKINIKSLLQGFKKKK